MFEQDAWTDTAGGDRPVAPVDHDHDNHGEPSVQIGTWDVAALVRSDHKAWKRGLEDAAVRSTLMDPGSDSFHLNAYASLGAAQ